MAGAWTVTTGRLLLTPVGWADMAELVALKGDPLVHAGMLGGVRGPAQVTRELAEETRFWAANRVGMWLARPLGGGAPVGLVGLHERPDGRGKALRFAFTPASRGKGFAREAAAAALRFAHENAGLERVVAMAREDNIASRTVLGAIGMREVDEFSRGPERVLVYESRRSPRQRDSMEGGWGLPSAS